MTMQRVTIKPKAEAPKAADDGGSYFSRPKKMKLIRSGCMVLDCAATGGPGAWPLGRIVNIVGDKSTGKTLLAIEACANFARQYPKGKIYYREVEAAFDKGYAKALGMPVKLIDFGDEGKGYEAIEDIFDDLTEILGHHEKSGVPGLYIIDSLDAVSDREELKRDFNDGTYAMTKQKKLSEMFRRLNQRIGKTNICVIVISQLRDNIGVRFGEKSKRSGGRALDFYASHVVWLAYLGKITKTVAGKKRAIGINIKAHFKKNKVSLPFREAEMAIMFGFGIDGLAADLDFIMDAGAGQRINCKTTKDAAVLYRQIEELGDPADYDDQVAELDLIVVEEWSKIEKSFLPRRTKY